MLLNLSNHPAQNWGETQLSTAETAYGEITDLPFPAIDPNWTSRQIEQLAEAYCQKVIDLCPTAVHLMGEMTFTFALIRKLKAAGIRCVASTTRRLVVQEDGHSKSVHFEFVQFREY